MVQYSDMIGRDVEEQRLRQALRRSRVVALVGPRQCGKTTLARRLLAGESPNYFDLEDPQSLVRLADADLALRPLRGLVVIDEVQRRPELFPLLRVLADRVPLPARFLILGSASGDLLRQSSESLAGRIERIELGGLRLAELPDRLRSGHWMRGGFPRSVTARSDADSLTWRMNFLQTFLERDLPQLGVRVPAPTLRRFWSMLAHYHGQTLNLSELGRSMDCNHETVRTHVDTLSEVFMVRQLHPWNENLGKRQVKAPKIYLRDTGILHALLGIRTKKELDSHPKVGASWEGYAVEEILKAVPHDEAYFWATHQQAELDLLLIHRGRRIGFECKRTSSPGVTPSMRIAMTDLQLDELKVVYPGTKQYVLAPRVTAVPLCEVVRAAD